MGVIFRIFARGYSRWEVFYWAVVCAAYIGIGYFFVAMVIIGSFFFDIIGVRRLDNKISYYSILYTHFSL